MRRYCGLLSIIITIFISTNVFANPPIEVAFSPKGGITERIVTLIAESQKTIRIAAYSFTSKPIAEALVSAHKRGIDIKVVLDKSQKSEHYTAATFLRNMGIPTRINTRYKIMHNKYMIIDEQLVQTGSFNYTKAAEKGNAENILILRDTALAQIYLKNWSRLWLEAE